MKRAICCLFILLLVGGTVSAHPSRADVKRRARPYTRNLPRIDKVQLELYRTMEMRIEAIEATKMIEGPEAQAIASLWRTQKYISFTADCHYPAYGVKFFSKGKVILYASLCWECDNIAFLEPKLGVMQGFDGKSRKSREMLEVFLKAFPR